MDNLTMQMNTSSDSLWWSLIIHYLRIPTDLSVKLKLEDEKLLIYEEDVNLYKSKKN